MSGILGIKPTSPFAQPVKINEHINIIEYIFTDTLVPLQSFGGSRLRSNIIRYLILKFNLSGGKSEGFNELRNAVG